MQVEIRVNVYMDSPYSPAGSANVRVDTEPEIAEQMPWEYLCANLAAVALERAKLYEEGEE